MLQRSQDKWNPTGHKGLSDQISPLLAINGIIVLILIGLVLIVPSASEWISAAVQAEFVNPDLQSGAPTQVAQPTEQMRVVRNN